MYHGDSYSEVLMPRVSKRASKPIVDMDRQQQIDMMLDTGAKNEMIFGYFAAQYPQIAASGKERMRLNGGNYIDPDKKLAEDIRNQIRVSRTAHDKRRAEIAAQQSAFGSGSVMKLADAKAEPLRRIQTTVKSVDWLWGYHEEVAKSDKKVRKVYGPPRGKISLMGGARGVGKSRWLVSIACQFIAATKRNICVFQNEVTQGQYRTWVENYCKANNISIALVLEHLYVSDQTKLSDQLTTIQSLKSLDLVIIDSIAMMPEAKTEAGQYQLCYQYSKTMHAMPDGGPHLIVIGHMNKQGEIKGSTAIQHYVDTVVYVRKSWIPDVFEVSIPDKNRYGRTGVMRKQRHTEDGVVEVPEDNDDVTFAEMLRAAS